jgi:hypothetical protein
MPEAGAWAREATGVVATIIQMAGGDLYVPISDSMPDSDQREESMPFVDKYVRASGTVFERKGTHAIVISEIKEMKHVHLTTNAKGTLRG